jgi:uncharacterized protein YxeA
MLKKVLATVLCLVMVIALVACTETGNQNTDSGNPSVNSDTNPNTDSGKNTDSGTNSATSDKPQVNTTGWDETMEHKFLATDVANASIIIVDMGLSKEEDFSDLEDCIIWEWQSTKDPTCIGNPGKGVDAAKLRYSEYYKKDVVIVCSSNGWAGVIDYEEKKVLWQWSFGGGNFHSIEMMPNGDVVVAGSGDDGKIFYIPLSAGVTKPSHYIPSPSGHGVMYDPQNNWLWVLDFDEVYACAVVGAGTKDAKLARIGGCDVKFTRDNDGHVLSPMFGEPGKYWVASSVRNYIFDSEELTLTNAPSHYTNNKNGPELGIKGIAYYEDKTMVMVVANTGEASSPYFGEEIRIVRMVPMGSSIQKLKPVTNRVTMYGREFYKVYPLNKNYQ